MSAKQTQRSAAKWLEHRQSPYWTTADEADFQNWLSDSNHMVAYLRLEAVWHRTDRLSVLRQPMRAPKPNNTSNIWTIARRSAAALIVAALTAAIAYQQWTTPTEATYVTAIGEHKAITFKDGTRVELNTDTVLRISLNSSERKAWLDKGEAYFEVEHDTARPFIVIANGRKVTDLGTKFLVRQDTDKLHVTVIEGLVDVEAKGKKDRALLKPGDILTATSAAQSIQQKSMRSILSSLNWKNGKLFLDYATLAEAAAEFNRYNTQKLIIKDQATAKHIIVGTFQTTDIAAFTKTAKEIFGLKAETKSDQIILSQ